MKISKLAITIGIMIIGGTTAILAQSNIKPILNHNHTRFSYNYGNGGEIKMDTNTMIKNIDAINADTTINIEKAGIKDAHTHNASQKYFNIEDDKIIISKDTPVGSYHFTYEACTISKEEEKKEIPELPKFSHCSDTDFIRDDGSCQGPK